VTIDAARRWAIAWCRAMRIYAYGLTEARNAQRSADARYFAKRYNAAHHRWMDATLRVDDMNRAATRAASRIAEGS